MKRRSGDFQEPLVFGEGNAVLVEVSVIDSIAPKRKSLASKLLDRLEVSGDVVPKANESGVACGVLEQVKYPVFDERYEIDLWSFDSGGSGGISSGVGPNPAEPSGGSGRQKEVAENRQSNGRSPSSGMGSDSEYSYEQLWGVPKSVDVAWGD